MLNKLASQPSSPEMGFERVPIVPDVLGARKRVVGSAVGILFDVTTHFASQPKQEQPTAPVGYLTKNQDNVGTMHETPRTSQPVISGIVGDYIARDSVVDPVAEAQAKVNKAFTN